MTDLSNDRELNFTKHMPLPTSNDFAKHIVELSNASSTSALHVTLTYKSAPTARQANANLIEVVPKFVEKAISINLKRKRYASSYLVYAFLDEPGSKRTSNFPAKFMMESVQDSYHHHLIILTDAKLDSRLAKRLEFPITESEKLIKLFDPTPAQSCFVQRLPSPTDLRRVANYAAKSVTVNLLKNPDEAYQIFN